MNTKMIHELLNDICNDCKYNKMEIVSKKSNHIVMAIATYICNVASEYNFSIKDVNVFEISRMFGASKEEQEDAYVIAKYMLKDFLN